MFARRVTAWTLASVLLCAGLASADATPEFPSSRCYSGSSNMFCAAASSTRSPGSVKWLQPFGKRSVWRTAIRPRPRLDPNNAARMARWLKNNFAKRPALVVHHFGVSVVVTRPGDPKYIWGSTLKSTTGWASSLRAFGPVPIPSGAKPDPDSDGHLAVYDPVKEREWDFWQARYDTATQTWWTGGGAAVSTATGSGIAPKTVAGANAANFPLLGGLVRPEELAAGSIEHALTFAQPSTARGYVCPATHQTESTKDPLAFSAGTHLQLDPSTDVSALRIPRWEKIVARALQKYGMYLRDTGGVLGIYAENPNNRVSDPYSALGFGEWIHFSAAFPWARMRVLAPTCDGD
jgi:hypothetical protein